MAKTSPPAPVAIHDQLYTIGDSVRVEQGPARMVATATKEFLAGGTIASHYSLGARDADGQIITIGQPMTYLDWLAPHGWYVYKLDDAGVWGEDSYYPDQAEALARGQSI